MLAAPDTRMTRISGVIISHFSQHKFWRMPSILEFQDVSASCVAAQDEVVQLAHRACETQQAEERSGR